MKFTVFGLGLLSTQKIAPIINPTLPKIARNIPIIPPGITIDKILATKLISNIWVEDLVIRASGKVIVI